MHLGEVKKICGIGVKEGVRWWNFLMIPLNTCLVMIISTFINAQIVFLLEDPDMFNISQDRIGVVSS